MDGGPGKDAVAEELVWSKLIANEARAEKCLGLMFADVNVWDRQHTFVCSEAPVRRRRCARDCMPGFALGPLDSPTGQKRLQKESVGPLWSGDAQCA
eukprot:363428-Chlamydomonas_euryale.AAC.1